MTNSFKPFFSGHFREVDGGVVLSGAFTMAWTTRVFLVLWFTPLTCVVGLALFEMTIKQDMRLAGLGLGVACLLLFGVWLVKMGKVAASDDVQWMSRTIRSVLDGSA